MKAEVSCETLLHMQPPLSVRLYRDHGKRVLDIILSFYGLLVLAPVACLVSFLVTWKLGNPSTYCQHRLGKNGHRFLLHKFRTMKTATDSAGRPLPDAQRMTRFGQILRSTSLDELPQLLDVLRGDMSLVGPRPLLVQYRHRYTQEEWHRHDVKPGITGWAAVHGRNALAWEAKFEYDLFYVENYCFTLDVKILWMTVAKVFNRSGVSAEGEATCAELRPELA
jgi:lipopolysaccharide/colanic/teichoic acid biosynthesis glycosyltransferase